MQQNDRLPKHAYTAYGAVSVFEAKPVLVFGNIFGGQISDVANDWKWFGTRRETLSVLLQLSPNSNTIQKSEKDENDVYHFEAVALLRRS